MIWKGSALLTWYVEGKIECQKLLTFDTVYPTPEMSEESYGRSGDTLRLVCSSMDRYATPPGRVKVLAEGDNQSPFPTAAYWRPGTGYCYSTTILKVPPPPSEAELINVTEEDKT